MKAVGLPFSMCLSALFARYRALSGLSPLHNQDVAATTGKKDEQEGPE
jgi:hypothetical protein